MIIAVWGKFDFKMKMRLFGKIELCRQKLRNHHQIVIEYFTQSCKEAKTAKNVMLSVSETSHFSILLQL
jgi:hypothetical protein